MERADAVVIGGGVYGAACTYALTRRGLTDVVLVEQAQLAFGSSGASAAVIETQYLDKNMIHLTNFGKRLCEQLEKSHGLTFVHHGYLRLGRTDEDLQRFRDSIAVQGELGITGSRILDQAAIHELLPGLRTDDLAGALWGPSDGYIDAVRYCESLVEMARQSGARYRRGRVVAVNTSGGAVTGVRLETDEREIEAPVVVNAAGAWARDLGRMVGLELPVDGYRRQVVIMESTDPLPRTVPFVIDYVPGAERPGLYFRDDGSSRIIAGLHWEGFGDWETPENPDRYNRGIDWEFGAQIRDALFERFPPAAEIPPNGGWAGLYPLTPDGKFILGPVASIGGYYNAIGGGGVGIQTSAGVGAVVADFILQGKTDLIPDPDQYRLERFNQISAARP